jgi:hypothetical protein
MNEHRLVEYGAAICAVVSQFSPVKPISKPISSGQGPQLDPKAYENLNPALFDTESPFYLPFPKPPFHQLTTAKMEVWERFQIKKESAKTISADPARPRQETTVIGYLADAIRAGFPVDIDRLGMDDKLAVDLSALADGKYLGSQIKAAYPEWGWSDVNIVAARNVIRDGFVGKSTPAVATSSAAVSPAPPQAIHSTAVSSRLPPIQQSKPVKHKGNALISEDDEISSPKPIPVRAPSMPTTSKPPLNPAGYAMSAMPSASTVSAKLQGPPASTAPIAKIASPQKVASPPSEPIDAMSLLDEIYEDTAPRAREKRKREDDDIMDDDILLVSSDDDMDVRAPKRLKTAHTVPSLLFHDERDAMDVDQPRALTQIATEESLLSMVPPPRSKLSATEDTVFAFLRGARGATHDELEDVFDGNLDAAMESLKESFSIYEKDGKYFCL